MIPKRLDDITASDILALVDNKEEERRSIDFKRDLPGGTDADKREFRADVSSFANSSGGDLVLGVEERSSVAVSVVGVPRTDVDAAILRMESMIQSGIDPRMPGIESKHVPINADRSVIVIRIPRSWRGPHLVRVNDAFRMYGRTSKGKYLFDAIEIRSAFASAESVGERLGRWCDDRVAKILANQGAAPLSGTSRLVLHVIPLASLFGDARLTASSLTMRQLKFSPPAVSGWNTRINVDGLLNASGPRSSDSSNISYCQVFRDGRVEGVLSDFVQESKYGGRHVPSEWFEKMIVSTIRAWLDGLREVGVSLPVAIRITFVGVGGARLGEVGVFDRDVLVFQDVVIESFDADLADVLRVVFDTVWNAAGGLRSPNYDAQGRLKA